VNTIADARSKGKQLLVLGNGKASTAEDAALDADVLLSHVLEKDRTYLFTWPEKSLSPQQHEQFMHCLERRKSGEPVAYIVGRQEFWSLPLKVNQHTLIPRPETELLVEKALQFLSGKAGNILDLGTGSGAIALALASECPNGHVTAVDYSKEALAIARENKTRLGVDNVELLHSDWFAAVPKNKFDLIVSNPPYIDSEDKHLSEGDVRFEPHSALVAEKEGFQDLFTIAEQSLEYLNHEGCLMMEHGYQQGEKVRDCLESLGYAEVQSFCDLAGHERVSVGVLR